MGGGFGADFWDGGGVGGFVVEAGHGDAVDAARGDGVEGGEGLRGDVEGEAVHGDPFADADAEGGDFAVADPDAGEAFLAGGGDVVVGEGADEGFLEEAEVGVEVLAVVAEVEDGVADELAGAVIGALAAAIDFDDGMRESGGLAEAGLVAGAADGVNGMVFEEEEGGVGVRCVEEGVDVGLLEGVGVLPGDLAEVLDGEEHGH